MKMRNWRVKRTFQASDSFGKVYTVQEQVEILDVSTFGNPNAKMDGISKFITSHGDPLNRLDDGTFLLVSQNLVLTPLG